MHLLYERLSSRASFVSINLESSNEDDSWRTSAGFVRGSGNVARETELKSLRSRQRFPQDRSCPTTRRCDALVSMS